MLGEEEVTTVSESTIEADLLVYLPRESLGWIEESLGIGMAAQGNRKQNRDSRERLGYPSLAVGSNL